MKDTTLGKEVSTRSTKISGGSTGLRQPQLLVIWMHASVDSQIVDCLLANIVLLSCLEAYQLLELNGCGGHGLFRVNSEHVVN